MKIDVRLATPEDAHLPTFDNTKLTAINTCPTWGILRYHMHKKMSGDSRAMALEAGGAMHETFAALRLLELKEVMGLADHFEFHGKRLFGNRFENMKFYLEAEEDERTRHINFCLEALHSSGYYDDPNDKKRTLANMEACTIAYYDRYEFGKYPIWIKDRADPTALVGIEVAFDLVVSFTKDDGTSDTYRFTGKIDGLHEFENGDLCVQENKTTSYLRPEWSEQWNMAHQVTGYCVAAALIAGKPCHRGFVRGVQIPLKQLHGESVCRDVISRDEHKIERWFAWFKHTVDIWEKYKDNVIEAPQYTHSCNRYFRTCSFMPFCDSPCEDKQGIIDDMVTDEWSPLHEVEDA